MPPPTKRRRGASAGEEEEEEEAWLADGALPHAASTAAVRPLNTTPAGSGAARAALWAFGAHAATRRQHALNTWAVMRAAAGRGDASLAAAAAAVALRAPVPRVEATAAVAGVPPGWGACVADPATALPTHHAALTATGRATALAIGIDALRSLAAAGGGRMGGVGGDLILRAARARVAAAPPVTPAADAASLGLALELAARGDTPQALAVLEDRWLLLSEEIEAAGV